MCLLRHGEEVVADDLNVALTTALNAERSGTEPWIFATDAKGPPKVKRKAQAKPKPKVNSKDLVDSSDISSCSSSHSELGSSDDSSS